jgi:hypothetical protein
VEAFRWPVGEPVTHDLLDAGSTEPDDRRTESGDRAGSGEVSCFTRWMTIPSGSADRTGVRADPREADRFQCGKQIAAYLGLVMLEDRAGIGDDWDISRNKGTH